MYSVPTPHPLSASVETGLRGADTAHLLGPVRAGRVNWRVKGRDDGWPYEQNSEPLESNNKR